MKRKNYAAVGAGTAGLMLTLTAIAFALCWTSGGATLCIVANTFVDPPGVPDSTRIFHPEVLAVPFGFTGQVNAATAIFLALHSFEHGTKDPAALWAAADVHVVSALPGEATTPHKTLPIGLTTRVERTAKGAPGGLTLSAENSLSSHVRLSVMSHGSVVWESASHAEGDLARVPDWPHGLEIETQAAGGLAYEWQVAAGTPIRVLHATEAGDTTVTGDEVRISGAGTPGASITHFTIMASGIDSLSASVTGVHRGATFKSKATKKS